MRFTSAALALLLWLVPVAAHAQANAVQWYYYGSSTSYPAAIPDTYTKTSTVSSATTTQVIAGVTNQHIYLFFLGAQNTSSNTSGFIQWEWGTGSTCTSPTTMFPTPNSLSVAGGATDVVEAWASTSPTGNVNPQNGANPAPVPLIIPAGSSVCMVTSGTIAGIVGIAYYSQF